jgi:hypothetical protein
MRMKNSLLIVGMYDIVFAYLVDPRNVQLVPSEVFFKYMGLQGGTMDRIRLGSSLEQGCCSLLLVSLFFFYFSSIRSFIL